MNKKIRRADVNDLDFVVETDLLNEGYTSNEDSMTPDELMEHRDKMKRFIVDEDKGTLIIEDIERNIRLGYIMYRISNRDNLYPWRTAFCELERTLFQKDGRFLEVFNLWVDSNYRRQGVATLLKKEVEFEAKKQEVNLVYTHTEEENEHVIELNRKLGYHQVRRGPIWDHVVRVSLIKHL
ncbi:GNAT family N-acetyltransferase [Paenibacillaceae bacterium]|nr:GNAT family N-acetyltransferase [Paenibacillaceae bacterium]